MRILYTLFISLMSLGMEIFSRFNGKVRKGVLGRRESFSVVRQKLKNKRVIWMHTASLGEYEQGLPVLEKLKEQYPEHKILITFFSPSGYENVVRKDNIADAVCYLPFDKKKDVRAFVSQFNIEIFFTVKYDFWYHLLQELKQRGTKIFVISALFYERQIFFKCYGTWFVKQLKQNVNWFFHQTKHSEDLAKKIGLSQSSVSGDTRFDRVKQIRKRDNVVPFIEAFKGNHQLVVFGSSWESEEKIAKIILEKSPHTKIIIAPHAIDRALVTGRESSVVKYSEITADTSLESVNCLLIDSVGLLSKLYSYADIAVVGGGFHSAGLHNILEAATFGIPVVFGNHYKKNPEADALIAHNGGFAFADENDAAEFVLTLLGNKKLLTESSQQAVDFVDRQPDAVGVILRKIL